MERQNRMAPKAIFLFPYPAFLQGLLEITQRMYVLPISCLISFFLTRPLCLRSSTGYRCFPQTRRLLSQLIPRRSTRGTPTYVFHSFDHLMTQYCLGDLTTALLFHLSSTLGSLLPEGRRRRSRPAREILEKHDWVDVSVPQ